MITLLSDWKLRDPYLGIFKGQLLRFLPAEPLVDITHNLELYNLSQAAFIAKNCFHFFPDKTLHIILSGLSLSNVAKPVLVAHNGHFFLGEDNGVFSMIFGADSDVKAYQYEGDMSLPETEKLALMAFWVFQNSYQKHTTPYPSLKFQVSQLSEPDFNKEKKTISGKVAYIDSNCNAVTNIPVSMFEAMGKQNFKAIVDTARPLQITRYHSFYNPEELEIFLVHNRLGFIEITLFNGNIAALADIHTGTKIDIQFE